MQCNKSVTAQYAYTSHCNEERSHPKNSALRTLLLRPIEHTRSCVSCAFQNHFPKFPSVIMKAFFPYPEPPWFVRSANPRKCCLMFWFCTQKLILWTSLGWRTIFILASTLQHSIEDSFDMFSQNFCKLFLPCRFCR